MVEVAEDEAVVQPAGSSWIRAVGSGSYKVNGDIGARYGREVVGENESHPGYVRRRRCVTGPSERKPSLGRVAPLEEALKNFDKKKGRCIVELEDGVVFDSMDEAFEFYNLYSWEKGFGTKCISSDKNDAGYELMKELVCMCQGKPPARVKDSVYCGCKAMMRLRRMDDRGWYMKRFVSDHNRALSESCG